MTAVIPLGAPGAKRYFTPAAETTARQDGWIMVQVVEAGVLKFAGKPMTEELARDLVHEVLKSGKQEYLLAGLLVEQGVKWTPDAAAANAEWFADLSDPESKAALRSQFIPLLAGFFLDATSSSAPSPSVSGTRTAPRKKAANGGKRSTRSEVPVPAVIGSDAPGS
jgi:hypothetical protein